MLFLSGVETRECSRKSGGLEEIAEDIFFLLSELSRISRPWTLEEDTINGLDLIDVNFESLNTLVFSEVPIGLMSSEELACDGIDGETRVLLGG